MKDSIECVTELKDLLGQYLEQTESLMLLLENEKEAFKQQNEALITTVTEQKQTLLENFKISDQKVMNFMTEVENGEPKTNLIDYIKQCPLPQKDELLRLWKVLSSMLERCKTQNMINGSIIGARLNAIKRNLDILKHGGVKEPVEYDAKGEWVCQIYLEINV